MIGLLWIGLSLSEAFVQRQSSACVLLSKKACEKPFLGGAVIVLQATESSAWDLLEQKVLGDTTASKTAVNSFVASSSSSTEVPPTADGPGRSISKASEILSNLLKETTTETTTIDGTSSSFLDQTSANAQSVLDSAKELVTLRDQTTDVAMGSLGNAQQQAVESTQNAVAGVPDALHQLQVTLQNLPVLKGAPPGEGLSKPIVDYVMTTLYEMRDSPYNPPNWIHMEELPQDFVTVRGGFEIKTSFLNAVTDATYTGMATAVETQSRLKGFAPYFVDNFKASYSKSAPFREQVISAFQDAPQVLSREYQYLSRAGAPFREQVISAFQDAPQMLSREYQDLSRAGAPFREQMSGALQEAPQLLSREYQALTERSAQVGDSLARVGSQSLDWDAWKASVDQLAMVQSDMQQLLSTPGWRPEDVAETLNLKELGPFYVGIAAAMMLALSYNKQRVASLQQNGNIDTAKTKPRRPQTTAPKNSSSGVGDPAQLEKIVADLTQATAILAAEMKGMATDLQELKGKQQLAPTAPVMQSAVESASANQAVAEAEDELAKKLRELEIQNELLRNQLSSAKFEADTLAEVNVRFFCRGNLFMILNLRQEALNAGVEALASLPKEPVVPQTSLTLEELGLTDAYFVEEETSKSQTADWSNLSIGALKKKTEVELRAYLSSKGVRGEDDNGRPLAKPDLLVLVMATA